MIDWDNYRIIYSCADIEYIESLFKEWCKGNSNSEDWGSSEQRLAFDMFMAGFLVKKNLEKPNLKASID